MSLYKQHHDLVGHTTSHSTLLPTVKSTINISDKEQGGRGAQASLKAMTAAQKKAEQLGT